MLRISPGRSKNRKGVGGVGRRWRRCLNLARSFLSRFLVSLAIVLLTGRERRDVWKSIPTWKMLRRRSEKVVR